MPTTTSPKYIGDLRCRYHRAQPDCRSHCARRPELINMGSIMVYNDPTKVTPDHRLRIILDAGDIPWIYGILLETIDSGPAGATDPVNATVDRKGSFKVEQLRSRSRCRSSGSDPAMRKSTATIGDLPRRTRCFWSVTHRPDRIQHCRARSPLLRGLDCG
jgi:hypothetical protein